MIVDAEQVPLTIGNGRYVFDRQIGTGGGGSVYLAHDQTLNRWVAIKRIEILDESSPQAALREAKNLASIQHPNIVTIYDRGNATLTYEPTDQGAITKFATGKHRVVLQYWDLTKPNQKSTFSWDFYVV